MKKLVLIILTFLSYNLINAQEFTQEEEEEFRIDSIRTFEKRQSYLVKDCGSLPTVNVSAVVRYRDHAEAYFEFIEEDAKLLGRLFLKSSEGENIPVEASSHKVFLNRLPLDKTLTLFMTNTCEEDIAITTIETTVNNQNYIKVSSKNLFNLVNEWASNKEGEKVGLHRFVLGLESVERTEKLAFLQDYYLNDNPYPELVSDGQIITTIDDESQSMTAAECNCKILELTTRGNISPGVVSLKNATITAGQTVTASGDFGKKSEWKYTGTGTGPAKKVFFDGYQRGCRGSADKFISTQNGKGTTGTPLLAEIQYSLICVGAQQNPGNCDCEKAVEVAYRYDTKVATKADTYKGICAQKDAWSAAEDWATVITEDANGIKVNGLEGIIAKGQCKTKVNPEFIITVIGMAAAVATTIATGGATAPLIGTLQPMLEKAVSTSVYSVNQCLENTHTQTLLNSKTTLTLKPGKTASARLYSFDAVQLGGYNAFTCNASINSNFYLATMIPGGKGGSLAGCCMAPKADWISASMDGPVSNNALINQVDYFLGINNLNATTNAGRTVGDHVQNCGFIDGIRIIKD